MPGRLPIPGRERRVATARAPARTHESDARHAGASGLRQARRAEHAGSGAGGSRVDCCTAFARVPGHERELPGRSSRRFRATSLPLAILIALMSAVGFVLLVAASMSPISCWHARWADRVSFRCASRSARPGGGLFASCWSRAACSRWQPARWASASPCAGVWLFANAVTGITFPYYIQWTIDGRVGLFVAAVCLGTALLVGLLPAVQVSRLAASRSLKEGERTATSGMGRRRLTTVLLTVELALTLVLLAGAGLMMRSFLAVYRADSVVDAARVVTMPVSLPDEKYPTPEQRTAAYQRLEERIDGIPGVSSTAFANVVPFAGGPSRQLSVDGRRRLPGESQPIVSYVTIRGRYFETLGLRLLRGRTFIDRDALPGSESAIVNQRLATMFFPDEDPIGRRICLTVPNAATAMPPACATIVGLSPTVRQQYFQDIDPVVYVPDRADASELMLIVRSDSTPNAVAPLIRAEVSRTRRGHPVERHHAAGPRHDGVEMGPPGVRGDVDGVCVRRVAAGSGRALCRDGVFRRTANSRNWGSHGSRSAGRRRRVALRQAGRAAGRRWHRRRTRGSVGRLADCCNAS